MPRALAEVDRVAAAGARGLKLHPNTQEFDVADDGVAKIVRRAGERGLPVLFDSWSVTDPAQPGKFVNLITGCPETQVILAHMLGPSFLELLVYRVLAEYPSYARNAWFELSGIAPLYADSPLAPQLTWLCRELGVDRVLFGSDYPFFDVGSALRAVDRLGFSPVELRQITHDNAASLFRRDDVANG